MGNTKLWSVWHSRDKKNKEIVVKVKEHKETDRHMKFRTITAKAAARRYIRNNLFGYVAKSDWCPCCHPDWEDEEDRKKLNGSLSYLREKYSVKIEVIK